MPPISKPFPGIFLSHSHADKEFVRKLASDLRAAGARVWIDEAELKLGDSLIQKIREGIDSMDYLAVILSPNSVNSSWVQKEVDIAMNQEIEGRTVKVVPLIYQPCELPWFLVGKFYADFTNPDNYRMAFNQVLARLGMPIPKENRQYNSYPFTESLPRARDLTADAQALLAQTADDDAQVIATDWRGDRLSRLKTGAWEMIFDAGTEAVRWGTALKELEARHLVQHIAARLDYHAYKLTPEGWDLAEFVRQIRR
jgi:hypothetical protein